MNPARAGQVENVRFGMVENLYNFSFLRGFEDSKWAIKWVELFGMKRKMNDLLIDYKRTI
jgi:hypothetical protein